MIKDIILVVVVVGICGYFYVTYHSKINDTANSVVATSKASADAVIKSALGSVSTVSPAYYLKNQRSYGVSATENICTDSTSNLSMGAVISTIQQHTNGVSCVADPDFPSRSFTLVAPSLVNEGKYYCTDQSGAVSLIPSVSSGSSFREGIKCK